MPQKKRTNKATKSKKLGKAPSNLVAALCVVGLVILAVTDLFQTNDIPSFIYYGLLGSILGAKFDEIFGGKRS